MPTVPSMGMCALYRKMSLSKLFLILGLCTLNAYTAHALQAKKLLVLVQDDSTQEKCSNYFSALRKAGVDVTIKGHKQEGLALKEYDTWLYDHLAIFAPKATGFGGSINHQAILEFVDSGRNVILAVDSTVSDLIRNLAAEVGVDLDEKGTAVVDHFSHAKSSDGKADHTLVISSNVISSEGIFGVPVKAPILFRGVAATVPADSELVTVAVSAAATSYSSDTRKSLPEPPTLMAGTNIALMSLVQARNNARVLVAGSVDMFSNELWDAQVVLPDGTSLGKSGNADVVTKASLWTLQARGVLEASPLRHRLLSDGPGSPEPRGYRVMDQVEVALDVFLVEDGKKKPYQAGDMQIEFVMLDPYVRLPLKPAGNGTFSLQFKVPDVYGVFKYVLSYRHQGYSYIELVKQVPVRPFKHNEYERFLVCAYPYYASALSSMAAFFVLGFFFLYHK